MNRRTIEERERTAWKRLLGAGLAVLVGASTGMIAVTADATLLETAVVTAAGTATGALLALYLSRLPADDRGPDARRRR